MAFDFSTLVIDRTQQDVAYAKQLIDKLVTGTATDAEKAEWNSFTLKGAYNHTDLNRVTEAMEDLKLRLEGYGYAVPGYQRIKVPHPEESRLPDGYTELAWIQSTGTQFVNTNFVPNQDTRVVMRGNFLAHSANASLFGVRTSASSGLFTMTWVDGNSYFMSNYGTGYLTVSFTDGNAFTLDKNKNVTTFNGNTVTDDYEIFTCMGPLYLFATNNNGSLLHYGSFQLYSCQIYDNGTLVRDYVPCIDPSGEVGLYDLVTATFYGNSGTGTFTAGNVVKTAVTATTTEESDLEPYLWYEVDSPTTEQMTVYLLNVSIIRSVLTVMASTPKVPSDMVELMVTEANDIELILLDVYRQLTIMPTTFIPCGEALCGGDNL